MDMLRHSGGLTKSRADSLYAALAAANTFTAGPQTINIDADGNAGLVINPHSATQSGMLLQLSTSGGRNVLSADATGVLTVGGGVSGPSGQVSIVTQNGGNARSSLVISHVVNADVISVTKGGGNGNVLTMTLSSAQSSGFVLTNTDAGTNVQNSSVYGYKATVSVSQDLFSVVAGAFAALQTRTSAGSNGDVAYGVDCSASSSIATSGVWGAGCRATAVTANVTALTLCSSLASPTAPLLLCQLKSSTTANRNAAEINATWATSTDASRKGRMTLGAHDASTSAGSPREGFRVESDGTQALASVYGVAAVARQLLATGAGHTVDDVITALQNFGILKQS